jgi:hypothetical protein
MNLAFQLESKFNVYSSNGYTRDAYAPLLARGVSRHARPAAKEQARSLLYFTRHALAWLSR